MQLPAAGGGHMRFDFAPAHHWSRPFLGAGRSAARNLWDLAVGGSRVLAG